MSEMGEKSIFIQIRATPQLRSHLDDLVRNSSADGRSEWLRMTIDKLWRQLPEDKR
jgi:hypothetical protein